MNIKKPQWAPYRRVASELKRLLGEGPVMDGTLSAVSLGSSVRYQLTRKEGGKTKTAYVPARAAKEVGDWTGRWREAHSLLKEMGEFSRGVFPSIVAKPVPKGGRGGSASSCPGGGRPRRSRTSKIS